jgi:threonine dehydratase
VPPGKVAQLRAAGVETVMLPFTQMADWLFRAGWRDEPWAFLHPWTEPALVAGHATVGLEILEDLPEVKTVFVPVGGGALAIGVAAAIKPRVPAARIVGVQTEACPALSKSISAGKPVWVERRPTVCEGVAVPFTTDQTFPALRAAVDAVVVVTEAEVRTGIALLYRRLGIKVEGAGALAFAAARRGFEPPAVAILSGGNIEPELFDSILAG